MKEEETQIDKEVKLLDQEIRIMDVMIKDHMDVCENLDLKVMGLELSEEVWKKKWEDQQFVITDQKRRLEQWEKELQQREERIGKGNKRNKSVSNNKRRLSN